MKTRIKILVQMVLLLLLSQLSFSQEVEVNLGGNSTSDAFVVRDNSGNVLLKMDGDRNFGINSEQPDGIEIKGRSTTAQGEYGDSIKIIGGSSEDRTGGSVSIIGGSSQTRSGSSVIIGGSSDDTGGAVTITSGDGGNGGGNIDIITDGHVHSGNINLRTGDSDISGNININTGPANGELAIGVIKLSTGGVAGSDFPGDITLAAGGRGGIRLLSSSSGIILKTTPVHGGGGIFIETGNGDGGNNIWLTVGDGTKKDPPRGILLNPNVGLVEIIGSGTYTGSWTQASDERYKSNIKPLLSISNKVNLLQPVEYEWNKDEFPENNFPDGNQVGLIAQEVEKLFPEIVATKKDGYKSIDYSKISVLLIQAIKEQSDEINKMKRELEELKSMIMHEPNKFSSNDNQQEVN